MLLCVCACSLPLAAQVSLQEIRQMGDNYLAGHAVDVENQQKAIEKAIDRQVPILTLKMGEHLFGLDEHERIEKNGRTIYNYIYRPDVEGASYRETVSIDSATNEATIIKNPANLIVGPLNWRYVSYDVSEIEITVYPYNDLRYYAMSWKRQFGEDCVTFYTKIPFSKNYIVDMLHTPTRAFTTKDGRMVVVSVNASSKEFGPYRRTCSVKAPGKLYKAFTKMADEVQRFYNK